MAFIKAGKPRGICGETILPLSTVFRSCYIGQCVLVSNFEIRIG